MTKPSPLPPLVARVSGFPYGAVIVVIDRADWAALLKVKVSALLVAEL